MGYVLSVYKCPEDQVGIDTRHHAVSMADLNGAYFVNVHKENCSHVVSFRGIHLKSHIQRVSSLLAARQLLFTGASRCLVDLSHAEVLVS